MRAPGQHAPPPLWVPDPLPCLHRINIEARKSPKLSRAAQEMSRSPRLPMRKPSIGSPSLTRREFPFEDITQVASGLRVGHRRQRAPVLLPSPVHAWWWPSLLTPSSLPVTAAPDTGIDTRALSVPLQAGPLPLLHIPQDRHPCHFSDHLTSR